MSDENAKIYARLRDEQFSLFENYARQNGLTSKSLFVLMWIYYNPEGLTQETIAKRTYSTKQVVRAIIKNLLEEGYVRLEPSIEDRRKKLVHFTDSGLAYARPILDPLESYEFQAMAMLTEEQQCQLIELTQLFSQNLKTLLDESSKEKYHA